MTTDLKNSKTVSRLLAPISRTASANGTGLDVRPYIGNLTAILDCSAASAGSSPTADFKIQDSADNSTFADVTGLAFTQVTDAAASLQTLNIDQRAVRRYIRAVFTIGGTSSPAFAASMAVIGEKQAQ